MVRYALLACSIATALMRHPARRSIRLWDVRAPRAPLLTQQLHSEPVMALALDARGRRGASGAADAQVRASILFAMHLTHQPAM